MMVGLIHSLDLQMRKLKQKSSSNWHKPRQSKQRTWTFDHYLGHLRYATSDSVTGEEQLNNLWVIYTLYIATDYDCSLLFGPLGISVVTAMWK